MTRGAHPVTTPSSVEDELAALWRESSTDDEPVLRACSMNLVVVCDDGPDEVQRATELVGRLAETVPGRALVVGPARETGGEGLDVYVSAHCHRGAGGARVCSEQLTLEASPASHDRVPATILQLLVEEMPVYTLWRRRRLDGNLPQPLVRISDYWVVDSDRTENPADQLRALRELATTDAWGGQIVDAAWARLEPWRDAIASFFDNPALRDALDGITRVEVGSRGPSSAVPSVAARYLGGWLASRLHFVHDSSGWKRADGTGVAFAFPIAAGPPSLAPIAVTIEAEHRDAEVVFRASRSPERDNCLLLTVGAGAHRLPERQIQLPALDEPALLCGMLQRTGRDPVYDDALRDAARIV